MTFVVRVTHPALADPEPREYNLDLPWDLEAFEHLLTNTVDPSGVMHLYQGDAIVIECVERDDSDISQQRRDVFV